MIALLQSGNLAKIISIFASKIKHTCWIVIIFTFFVDMHTKTETIIATIIGEKICKLSNYKK